MNGSCKVELNFRSEKEKKCGTHVHSVRLEGTFHRRKQHMEQYDNQSILRFLTDTDTWAATSKRVPGPAVNFEVMKSRVMKKGV